jgi:dienelactone hydrolase
MSTVGGTDVYSVGAVNEFKRGILYLPDIFGYHANTMQVADVLASAGFLVVMPDFFHGKPWPTDNFPPKEGFDGDEWKSFVGRITNWDAVKNDIETGIKVLKDGGADSIGAIGMCWGAKFASAAGKNSLVNAVAGIHPSFFDVSDGKDATTPMLVITTQEDPVHEDIQVELKSKPFAAKNVWHRWDDVHHGFLGARGQFAAAADYSDNNVAKRANEAIGLVSTFFNATL